MAVKTVAVREGETCAVVMGHLRRRIASCAGKQTEEHGHSSVPGALTVADQFR